MADFDLIHKKWNGSTGLMQAIEEKREIKVEDNEYEGV